MEFDKSKVYTSLNADELKIGSKVFAANCISMLKRKVHDENCIDEVKKILEENHERRFQLDYDGTYPFVYLISEPEEKKLKWTDLKIGDVIQKKSSTHSMMVIGIDYREESKSHILIGEAWLDNDDLECYWEKVE